MVNHLIDSGYQNIAIGLSAMKNGVLTGWDNIGLGKGPRGVEQKKARAIRYCNPAKGT